MSAIETAFEVISESLEEAEGLAIELKTNEKEIENLLEDAKAEMDGLKLHINASPPSSKAEYMKRLRALETQYSKLERKLLVGDVDIVTNRNKTETESQHDSLARLEAARQQLVEAEEIGTDTLVNLQQQRETLEKTRDNLKETNQELGVSNNFLNRMSKWWRG